MRPFVVSGGWLARCRGVAGILGRSVAARLLAVLVDVGIALHDLVERLGVVFEMAAIGAEQQMQPNSQPFCQRECIVLVLGFGNQPGHAQAFPVVGGLALMLGLGTRFFALALLVVTIVATAAVHWPAEWHSLAELAQGYVITDDGHGNFKLPLIFMVMLWPLMFFGAGRISLDALLGAVLRRKTH